MQTLKKVKAELEYSKNDEFCLLLIKQNAWLRAIMKSLICFLNSENYVGDDVFETPNFLKLDYSTSHFVCLWLLVV